MQSSNVMYTFTSLCVAKREVCMKHCAWSGATGVSRNSILCVGVGGSTSSFEIIELTLGKDLVQRGPTDFGITEYQMFLHPDSDSTLARKPLTDYLYIFKKQLEF